MKNLSVLEGTAGSRVNDEKIVIFTVGNDVSVNNQIIIIWLWFEDEEKIWKVPRKIQFSSFFLKPA